MQDRQLYEQILGISRPWYVDHVDLKLPDGEVHVYLAHDQKAEWACPECGKSCGLHDHEAERSWRHLDTCQYQTVLHAAVPRTQCPEHGVRLVRVPWVEPFSRFTLLFERLVIDWLTVASQKAVAEQLSLSWDEIHGIMERAVQRGLRRRQAEAIPQIGVDEKSFRKGHRYATLVNDLRRGRVLYVARGREKASLDGFWSTLTTEQRDSIEAIALDMCDAYVSSIQQHVPQAEEKMVYDKFHIAKHLNEAVDRVRRSENKQLRAQGDDRLVGSKYDWLRHPDNFDGLDWWEFQKLRRAKLKTARAWAIKEAAMVLWDYRYVGAARNHFSRWYSWAIRSRLAPIKQKAKMLKERLANIVTYIKQRITNATSESLNAKIQWVKYTARGFRNFQNFITAIYFHCGGLDMTPGAT